MENIINHGWKTNKLMTEDLKKIFQEAKDFLPLLGTDYVEFYVGNAKQAAHFYKTALGFQSLAYAGLETGVTDRTSYVVVQDKIRLMFTTPMPGGENQLKTGGVRSLNLSVASGIVCYSVCLQLNLLSE